MNIVFKLFYFIVIILWLVGFFVLVSQIIMFILSKNKDQRKKYIFNSIYIILGLIFSLFIVWGFFKFIAFLGV